MRRSVLLLLLANFLGSLTYIAQKDAFRGLPPGTVTFLRNLLGTVLMAAWILGRRQPLWPFERRETGRLALLGALGLAAPMLAGAEGLLRSTATNGAILILLEPVALVLFARILLGERMGTRRAAGLALGLAGALAVVTEGASSFATLLQGEHLFGNVLLALCGILWGLYTPLMKPLTAEHSAVALTFAAMAVALPFLALPAAVEAPRWSGGPELGAALLWTAALGVFGSFLGTVMWTAALRDIPANAVAPMILLQPVFGTAAGVAFLGERPTARVLLGGALVAVGALVAETGSAKPTADAPADGFDGGAPDPRR